MAVALTLEISHTESTSERSELLHLLNRTLDFVVECDRDHQTSRSS
jgi:hypothetical protein